MSGTEKIVGGGNPTVSSAMTELVNAFRGYFKLTDKLGIEDMTKYLEEHTFKEYELLSTTWSHNCPLSNVTIPIKQVPQIFLNATDKVKITIDFKTSPWIAFNLVIFNSTSRHMIDDTGLYQYTKTVKPSQLKNLVIAINTGQYGTLSITSVKLTML